MFPVCNVSEHSCRGNGKTVALKALSKRCLCWIFIGLRHLKQADTRPGSLDEHTTWQASGRRPQNKTCVFESSTRSHEGSVLMHLLYILLLQLEYLV